MRLIGVVLIGDEFATTPTLLIDGDGAFPKDNVLIEHEIITQQIAI